MQVQKTDTDQLRSVFAPLIMPNVPLNTVIAKLLQRVSLLLPLLL